MFTFVRQTGPRIGTYYDGTLISTEIVHQTFDAVRTFFKHSVYFPLIVSRKKRNKTRKKCQVKSN